MTISPEVGVPQASWQIDAILKVGEASTAWGPLQGLVRNREVVLEHYRRTPNLQDFLRANAKHACRADTWGRTSDRTQRPPLLVILSGGRPRTVLQFAADLVPWKTKGLYRASRSTGDVILIDTKHLGAGPGTSVFRMTRTPDTPTDGWANLRQLLADPCVPIIIANNITEFIVTTRTDSDAYPERAYYINLWRKGLEEGHEKGLEKGLEEGREKGLEEGREKGLEEGREKGLEEGRAKGLEEGREKGLEEGREKGLEEGREKGLEEGREEEREAARLEALLRVRRIASKMFPAHEQELAAIDNLDALEAHIDELALAERQT